MTANPDARAVPVIWRVLDDRTGHQNQVLGLTDAIQRQLPVICHDVRVGARLGYVRFLFPGRSESLRRLPSPDLLIGAGHASHLPLLVLQRRFGGRTIVLMKPSIPMAAFDLCIVPSVHRFRHPGPRVIQTEGVLNRMQPSNSLSVRKGMILIGGPSPHYQWSDDRILQQLTPILAADDGISWVLTTSRRTPATFRKAWCAAGAAAELIPFEQTTADWLPEMLRSAGNVWVSSDSVSMVFESLTAGAAVGVLELTPRRLSRVVRLVAQLSLQQRVTTWSSWVAGRSLQRADFPLREADRCAEMVVQRYFSEQVAAAKCA